MKSIRTLTGIFFYAIFCAALPCVATICGVAHATDTALIHIGVDDTGQFGMENIENFLQADARFSSVANIDVDTAGVPTLAQLSAFDSVLIVTDNRSGDISGGGLGTQLGDVLDDYALADGLVVLTAFAGNDLYSVGGQLLAIAPHTVVGANANAGDLDFMTADLAHPIFDNVSSFDSTFASDIGVAPGGTLLASYLSGTPAVLTNADDSVRFVNGFPATEDDYTNGSDFGLLFANALVVVPEPTSAWLALLALSAAWRRKAN